MKVWEPGEPIYKSQSHSQRVGENVLHRHSLGRQAGSKRSQVLSSSLCFMQTLPELDDVHPHWEGSPAIPGPLIQVLILSRNIFGDTNNRSHLWSDKLTHKWTITVFKDYQMNAPLQPAPITRDHPHIFCLTLSHPSPKADHPLDTQHITFASLKPYVNKIT